MVKDNKTAQRITEALAVGRPVAIARLMSEILSVVIFFIGCVVLLGWTFDITVIKSGFSGWVTMKANTAICFVMIGTALWCLQTKRVDNVHFRLMASLCVAVILVIGLGTFCEYVFQ